MTGDADLWTYSLRVYGDDDVAASCLWLQDHHAVDVNLLLYCCWLGSHGFELDSSTLSAAQRTVAPWTKAVVEPLRSARRWMKAQIATGEARADGDYAALRERIKAAELEAERLEQGMLERLPTTACRSGTDGDDSVRLIANNAARYLSSIGGTIDAHVADRLRVVVARASGSSQAIAAHELGDAIRTTMSVHD